jgi:hypothetical protein
VPWLCDARDGIVFIEGFAGNDAGELRPIPFTMPFPIC